MKIVSAYLFSLMGFLILMSYSKKGNIQNKKSQEITVLSNKTHDHTVQSTKLNNYPQASGDANYGVKKNTSDHSVLLTKQLSAHNNKVSKHIKKTKTIHSVDRRLSYSTDNLVVNETIKDIENISVPSNEPIELLDSVSISVLTYTEPLQFQPDSLVNNNNSGDDQNQISTISLTGEDSIDTIGAILGHYSTTPDNIEYSYPEKNNNDSIQLVIDNQTEIFLFEKAYQYNLDGLHDKAIEVYERILADKPNHGLALYNLGLSKYELNDIRKACIYIDRSLKLGINEARDFVRDHCRW
ncbi:MAG: tetratricopeptide repeat protein [Saprospiraceae bacterium]|nr:tetratricopeptide repeat protein [Saprospiraceae bacterium]